MKKSLLLGFTCVAMTACASYQGTNDVENGAQSTEALSTGAVLTRAQASYELVLASEVTWDHLNPARGDKAPQAGTLWGDRNGTQATGFLLKPNEGFKSPPHIHNVSYRAVVIEGELHNDDPDAANMWMPAGSYWTQPKGEVHITSAKGPYTLAYVEIESGPYLVRPTSQAYDSHERPVNVDNTNLVWLSIKDTPWDAQPILNTSGHSPEVALLWGQQDSEGLNGTFLRLPADFNGRIISNSPSFRAVVIKGQPKYQAANNLDITKLIPGSYFASKGIAAHQISAQNGAETILYIRAQGQYQVIED